MKRKLLVLCLSLILVSSSLTLVPIVAIRPVNGVCNGGLDCVIPKYVAVSCLALGVGAVYWFGSYHLSLSGCEV